MIENSALGSIMGAPAVGPDGDKIGTVGQVFVEPTTGMPNWATVHTGLFGRHENFVPLDRATWDRESLHLPYDKDMVKDAPRIDADEALSPESEAELYRYYDITPDAPLDSDSSSVEPVETRHQDAEAEAAGAEYSRESRMRRYEASGDSADVASPASPAASPMADTASPEDDGPKHRA